MEALLGIYIPRVGYNRCLAAQSNRIYLSWCSLNFCFRVSSLQSYGFFPASGYK